MQLIPLHQLTLSETYNVRKTHRNQRIDELAASIASHGLLENLLVVRNGDGYEVIAGGRRLAALQQLSRENRLSDDFTVPCELVPEARAHEISLAENAVRESMHPADQFEAWAQLVDQGLSTADISARFGIREELVRQRLKLGRVSPRLLQAYRDETISLEVVMAYTLTEDHAQQESLFDRLQGSWQADDARTVRRMLTEHTVSSDDRQARLIGAEAYAAAGGAIRRDLFAEDYYFEDPELLDRLVLDRLTAEAERLRTEWAWVEVRPEFPYEERSRFRRIYAHALGEPPEELADAVESLTEQIDELSGDDEQSEECESLHAQLNTLQAQLDAYHGFTDEERAVAGCVVTLGYRDIEICEGLLRQGQQPPAATIDAEDATVPPKPRYGERLRDRLKSYRLHAVRLALARDFHTAIDTMVYALCCRQFGMKGSHCLGTVSNEYYYPVALHDDETLTAMKAAESDFLKQLPLGWMNEEDDSERFALFCALPLDQKQQLLSACVALSLRPQLTTDASCHPEFETIAGRLGVDVAAHWRPTADSFLSRVAKSELLEIGTELYGESWAHTHRQAKKARLVELLDRAFADPAGEEASRIASWLPEGMACGTSDSQ